MKSGKNVFQIMTGFVLWRMLLSVIEEKIYAETPLVDISAYPILLCCNLSCALQIALQLLDTACANKHRCYALLLQNPS